MSVDDLDLPVEPELDARLRETLSRVAMTVGDTAPGPDTSPVLIPASARRPRRRRWRPALTVIGVALTALILVGFAYLHFGPEYVTEQKLVQLREDALVEGGAEPNRYWLVPSFHNDACGRPMPGVELVAESDNRVGGEWSTAGIAYGEPVSPTASASEGTGVPSPGCVRIDERGWLNDPSRFALTTGRLGQHTASEEANWALLAAVHPAVHTLRVTTPGSSARRVSTVPRADRPHGPRYAVIVLPATATRTRIVLLDEQGVPVPGGVRNLELGR